MRSTRPSINSRATFFWGVFFRCVRVCWRVVEFQPRQKPKETEDTVDVEGAGQIICCFISKGRADRKRPAPTIYAQLARTHPLKQTVPLKHVVI